MVAHHTMDDKDAQGNRARLDKIDKLRELGISDLVSLPQLVVVGDQSAGKSSVLESLTGFHFPRSVTLCTRHATEIICRREETEGVTISIVPHSGDPEREKLAKEFRRVVAKSELNELGKIFQDAAEVMGIRSASDDPKSGSAFSRDVLRVEISGPTEEHLTVIDVPGMFENATPGLTTTSDIELVKTMVKGYIRETRTIILAVVPCNGDIANQKILTFAAEADPEGKRTLGVLTKPDLAVENATKEVVVDLVLGKRRDLQLGYCVVKNRGADDSKSSLTEGRAGEHAFFSQAPWTKLPKDRLGIPALHSRLQQLLMDRTKSEFPLVRKDLDGKLKESKQLLKSLGDPRSTVEQQRMFVGMIANRFMQLKAYGLDNYYSRDKIFEHLDLRLITRIRNANEAFSQVMHERGHTRIFAPKRGEVDGSVESLRGSSDDFDLAAGRREDMYEGKLGFSVPLDGEDALEDILDEPYRCPFPLDEDIMDHIKHEYLASRGYEIGTFGGEMIPTTFKEQSKKWRELTLGHVSNVILIVDHFIRSILAESCPDPNIRDELWEFCQEDLENRYKRAKDHAQFLLDVELEGKSISYNPEFLETLNKLRIDSMRQPDEAVADGTTAGGPLPPPDQQGLVQSMWEHFMNLFQQKNSLEATSRDIHDGLQTFYFTARSRFVDVVCQQVIDHFLLHSPDGPLAVLSNKVVLAATPEQLERIAGEDMATRLRRETLTRQIEDLSKALKVLRG